MGGPSKQFMLVSASHSPVLDFPAEESEAVASVIAALAETKTRVEAFDPDLIILFGVDHYGGHQMHCMPSFSVGVEATSIAMWAARPAPLMCRARSPSAPFSPSADRASIRRSPSRWRSTTAFPRCSNAWPAASRPIRCCRSSCAASSRPSCRLRARARRGGRVLRKNAEQGQNPVHRNGRALAQSLYRLSAHYRR